MAAEAGDKSPAKFFQLPDGDYPFLNDDELQLLHEIGLPQSCSSFTLDGVEDGMPRVDEVYGPNDEQLWSRIGRDSVARFRMLGDDSSGNPIVLDVETHEIVLLDHEGDFKPFDFVNSSIAQLMESLLVFTKVESDAPEVDVEKLRAALHFIDSQVTEKQGHWFTSAADLVESV